jgi:hypothetical protein
LWLEEYCQTSPNKNKSPNLWHVTSILVCYIFDHNVRIFWSHIFTFANCAFFSYHVYQKKKKASSAVVILHKNLQQKTFFGRFEETKNYFEINWPLVAGDSFLGREENVWTQLRIVTLTDMYTTNVATYS